MVAAVVEPPVPVVSPAGTRFTMKVRSSIRSLARKPGSVVIRRKNRLLVINRKNPHWNGRQG
jgi:large subunit ribosomal protein L36